MAITGNTFFVANRFGHGLAQGNAHVFYRVVAVDVQIARGLDFQIDQTVARNLVEHVVKETNTGRQFGHARTVKIDLDSDLGFGRFTADFGSASSHGGLSVKQLASRQKEKATKQG
jgi:hypothetical protein